MLDSIKPDSIEQSELGLKAQVGAFRFEVECSHRDTVRLLDTGDEIYCQLETDDTSFHLVGFASDTRRNLYKGLRGVAGIGRRSALVVLDCGEVIDVLRAVASGDKTFFRSVPGVGPKRIDAIVETLHKRYSNTLPKPVPIAISSWVEARDALLSTEPDPQKADALLRKVSSKGMNTQSLILAAEQLFKNSAG